MKPVVHILAMCLVVWSAAPIGAETLQEANDRLFAQLESEHVLNGDALTRLREIFARSGFIGQGNPAITRHPMPGPDPRWAGKL